MHKKNGKKNVAEEPIEDVISVSEEIYVAQEERTVINEIDAPAVVLLEGRIHCRRRRIASVTDKSTSLWK